MILFNYFLYFSLSRGPRIIHIDPNHDGDCFDKPCAMKTATLVVRAADTVIFPAVVIHPNSYPSEFSDLFIQLTLMNTTVLSKGTVVDGKLLAGEMLWQITSHPVYTWTVFENWTFRHFSKPIAKRQYTWSTGPFVIFKDCTFEDCDADLFTMSGGTIIFENCIFRNIKNGRIVKAVSEVRADFTDCSFENCNALFFHGSDASFVNCRFNNMNGQRGGAVYAAKSTIYVERCLFMNCNAEFNGGAIYIRDSPKNFECEVKNSCFINTHAGINGSAIYAYLSYVELSGNCYSKEDDVMNFAGEFVITNTTVDSKCIDCMKMPPAEMIPNDYTPVDTNKWYQFDDLKSDTTIIIDDDDDL